MFEPAFYLINESYDSNLTNYTNFSPQLDYVVRFVIDGWEAGEPSGAQVKDAARAIATIIAESGDLSRYRVKGIAFNKVPTGESVGYYSASWYTISVGRGYTDTLTAGSGTWVVDIVFRPSSEERAWTSVSDWCTRLAAQLKGSQGAVTVHCAGVIALDVTRTVAVDAIGPYMNAITFWGAMPAFWEAYSTEGKETGDVSKINDRAPATAWAKFPPYIGQDGRGVAKGSAFDPVHLVPLAVESTITPDFTGILPGTGGSPFTTQEKVVAVGIGALALYVAWYAYTRWADR